MQHCFTVNREEQLWMEALVSRNNVAHASNQAIALDIVKKTKQSYYLMFVNLEQEIKKLD